MESIVIRENIAIEPKDLDSHYKQHLLSKAREKLVGKCFKEYGYVFEVDPEMKIFGNEISTSNQGIFFKVELCIKRLLPQIGQVHDAVVEKVDDLFLSVKVLDIMLVYIQIKQIEEMDMAIPEKGDKIKVRISTKIKYNLKKFSCMGEIVVPDIRSEKRSSETKIKSKPKPTSLKKNKGK
jgi:DNA-directed RNA polymerase subunit E'/Rpb7